VELSANDFDNILLLKANVEDVFGIPPANQKWIYQGRILADHLTLKDSGISEGNTVQVVKVNTNHCNQGLASPSVPVSISSDGLGSPYARSTIKTEQFDQAFKVLLTNDEDIAKEAIITLSKIVSNVVQNPLDEKFRKLKISNQNLYRKLLSRKGGCESLIALGFIKNTEEWVMYPNPDAWDNLVACHQKLVKFNRALMSSEERTDKLTSSDAAHAGISSPQISDVAIDPVVIQDLFKAFSLLQNVLLYYMI